MKVLTSIWWIISFWIILKHFKMHITINDVKGEKRIDLSYPIHSFNTRKEIAVISAFSNNIQYEVVKSHTIIDDISPGNKKLILSKTYAGKELISVLEGMIELTQFKNDERGIKTNKLRGITEIILNFDELDNTVNLEDGRPSNVLYRHHVTDSYKFTQLATYAPQYKRLKNGEFTSLTLRITDQNGNIITDGPKVTVVLHICDCKL